MYMNQPQILTYQLPSKSFGGGRHLEKVVLVVMKVLYVNGTFFHIDANSQLSLVPKVKKNGKKTTCRDKIEDTQ